LAGGLLVAALVDVQASSGAPAAVSTVQRPRRPACTIWTSILLGSPWRQASAGDAFFSI